MSKVKQQDIDRLIVLVGGRENIATVSHCITRLRFVLNDPSKASPKEIEELPMVKGCFTNAGQFRGDRHRRRRLLSGADRQHRRQRGRQRTGQGRRAPEHDWTERTISHFAEIFFPLLPALISGGLILGFRNVIGDIPMSGGQTLAQMHPAWKTVYDFLWLLGEAIFMFLPVAICWSTVKRWAARRCSASCWASPRCRRS